MKYILIILAIIYTFSVTAEENPYTTEKFSAICENETQGPEGLAAQVMCLAYIQGAMEMYTLLSEIEKNPGLTDTGWQEFICFPENATTTQTQKVFIKWVKDNPEYLHEQRAWSLFVALTQTEMFHCTHERSQWTEEDKKEFENYLVELLSTRGEKQ